jgi:hypothetical protein
MTSTYETVEGTKPTTHGKHEPRVIQRVIIPDGKFDDEHDLHMMTEIGDGTFVAWSGCRRCGKRVYNCKCAEGPQEPPYMKKWRDQRFEKDLNTRPDPSYDLLDSVIEWVRERGYTVTKDEVIVHEVDQQELADGREDAANLEREITVFEQVTGEKPREPQSADPIAKAADSGLDAALEKVRFAHGDEPAKDYDDIPDDF